MNTTVQTKKNRKEFWFNHIKKWQASGKTQVDYCKINKLNERTFSSRKKSLMSPKKELESPLLFHPIKESKSKFKKKNIFKIKLSNGMELSFEETPNPIWFGKLISEINNCNV